MPLLGMSNYEKIFRALQLQGPRSLQMVHYEIESRRDDGQYGRLRAPRTLDSGD